MAAGLPQWYLVLFAQDGAELVAMTSSESVLSVDEDGNWRSGATATRDALASAKVSDGALWLRGLRVDGDLRVNGEVPVGPTLLLEGDVVSCPTASMVVTQRPLSPRRAHVMRMAELATRLRQETARSLRYGAPISVMVLLLETPIGERARAFCDLITRATRSVDLMAWDRGTEAVFVFPETGGSASVPAERLLRALEQLEVQARAGLASCPNDGSDPSTLLSGARAAARAAELGRLRWVGSLTTSLELGGRAIVAIDPSTQGLLEQTRGLAKSTLPVLLQGETGVGKEVLARLIHQWSPRHAGPFVSLNCGAIAETLLEAELFGYERGAFTGANGSNPGLFESAAGGTIFLDELGEGSRRMQVELLRVLDSGTVRRIGSSQERPCDVRLVAATNRDLDEEVGAGRFRRDLLYRLNAATVHLPALRERLLDLPVMARTFLAEACTRGGRPVPEIAPDAMKRMLLHDWPGNVRELKNLVEYLAAVVTTPTIEADQIPDKIGARSASWLVRTPARRSAERSAPSNGDAARALRNLSEEVAELESTRMRQALEAAGGVRVRAAALIGMPQRTFVTKLKRYGLSEPSSSRRSRGGAHHGADHSS